MHESSDASEAKDPGDAVDWKDAVIPNELKDAGEASETIAPSDAIWDTRFAQDRSTDQQRLNDFAKTIQDILTLNQWY